MSVVDRGDREDVPTGAYPEFDLQCLLDDWEEPTELTVFSAVEDDDLATTWLSIDACHAVALEDVR